MTFSTVFPRYHPKAGQPTYFPEKIWAGLADDGVIPGVEMEQAKIMGLELDFHQYYNARIKSHTMRAGRRWKAGDWFSPRIWSGTAYRSPQIQFAPAIQVKKTWDIEIWPSGHVIIDRKAFGELLQPDARLSILCENDGLSVDDAAKWFLSSGKTFDGQIICWNDKIKYR